MSLKYRVVKVVEKLFKSYCTEPVSTVGAGDSFLAGMTCGLAQGRTPAEAFRMAVAAGAAATLSAGTDLAYAADLERLLPEVPEPRPA